MSINIAFILDDGFVIPTATALASLIENKDPDTIYDIYLITNNLSSENVSLFHKLGDYNNVNINIKHVNNSYDEFCMLSDSFKVTTTALFKFNLPAILSELDKVLYIDGDTIIQKDLSNLYNTELESCYAGVIEDYRTVHYYKPSIMERLNISHKSYFNTGVMVLNLKKMRTDNITKELFDYKKNGKNFFMDQDAFNVVFKENVKYLEPFYNFLLTNLLTFSYKKFMQLCPSKMNNIKSYDDFIKNSTILHYASPQKPWLYHNAIAENIWYKYYRKSILKNKKLKRTKYKLKTNNLSFAKEIFSVTKDANKTHKIISILGLKFKIKLKTKALSEKDIIVSLTSYPARINKVEKTIKSLLNQTLKPKKVVLALGEDKFPNKENDLPESLKNLLSDKFEILWTPYDLRSYTKLIPTLKEYPNNIIVTVDDDIIYEKERLSKLYKAYKKQPNIIHCHRVHRILFDKKKQIKPYIKWKFVISNVKPSFNNFLTGVGGVLYPPNVLHPDIFKEEVFKDLAPMADDIWFWAMAVLNNTKINVIKNNCKVLEYIEGTQDDCLWATNQTGKNDEQLKNILNRYPEILEKLDKRIFIPTLDFKEFLQQIFSIKNVCKNNVKHKIVTILGVKIKFKRSK